MDTEAVLRKGPNWELIDKALMEIEHHPDNFNMESWAKTTVVADQREVNIPLCGTTMCFAGWVVSVAGDKINWPKTAQREWGGLVAPSCTTPKGERKQINVRAMELLNIDEHSADAIFLSTDIATVEELREKITSVLGQPE